MILQIGRPNLRKSRAFTLIELVLVTIIILIVTGLSPTIFRRTFSSIQLKDTCQNLIQLMRYAQAKAIAERRLCRINFDLEENSFWLTVEDEAAPGEFKKIGGKWGKVLKAAEGISINTVSSDEKVSLITFYPDGTSAQAEINISDVQGKTFLITSKRTISYVEIKE